MLSDLAFFLAGRGHEVVLITSRQRYDAPGARLTAEEHVNGVVVHRVWTSRFGRGFLPGRAIDYLTFYLSTAWRLLRLVRPGDVVVAKTDPPMISVPAGWVACLQGAWLVNWLQDLFPEVAAALGIRLARGAAGRLLAGLRDRSLKGAVMNVAIGEGMRQRLLTGVDSARGMWSTTGPMTSGFRPLAAAANPLRGEWGLGGKFVVGYSETWAAAMSTRRCWRRRIGWGERDVVFLFIGGGASMDGLRVEAQARGIGNLIFRPYQPPSACAESLAVPDVHLVVLRPEMEGLIVRASSMGSPRRGGPRSSSAAPKGDCGAVVGGARRALRLTRVMGWGWRRPYSGCGTTWRCASAWGRTRGGCARSGSLGERHWSIGVGVDRRRGIVGRQPFGAVGWALGQLSARSGVGGRAGLEGLAAF